MKKKDILVMVKKLKKKSVLVLFFILMMGASLSGPDISSDLHVSSAFMHNMVDDAVFGVGSVDSEKEGESSATTLQASLDPTAEKDMMNKISFYGDISDSERQSRRFENDPFLKKLIERLVTKEKIKNIEFHISKSKDTSSIQMRVTTPIFSEDFTISNSKIEDEPVHYMYYPEGSSVYGVVADKKERCREFRFFSRDGVMLALFSLKEGLYEGDYQTFYPNGKPKNVYSFREGKEEGPYKKYNSDGLLTESGSYADDKKDGLITFYGVPEDASPGEKITLYVEHYDQGRLVQRDFYKNKVVSKVETY